MNLLAVFVGGLIGTGLRLAIDALLPHADDGFPWSTLLINVTGSFALGMLVSRVWTTAPEWVRLGLGTGVLGSFTTFSALVTSVVLLATLDHALLAVVYLAVTLVAGVGAALLGLWLGQRPVQQIGREQ